MKTRKTIFTITVVIALLLTTLCGCMETNNAQSEDINNKVEDSITPMPFGIKLDEDTNLKDEFIKHIQNSKTINKGDDDEYCYYNNNISSLKQFYILDNFIIDGYKLSVISVTKAIFRYCYFPIEMLEKEDEYGLSFDESIEIIIQRPEYEYSDYSDPLDKYIEEERGLTDDGLAYSKWDNSISAQMGDTVFTITSPDELNSYEYLRDLAFKLIETAELVVVGE